MTSIADTAGDVLRRIYDPKPPMSPDQYIDRVALFAHSKTAADFMRQGRAEYRWDGGSALLRAGNVLFFVDADPQYAGKRLCVDDSLEPGKIYTRVSPTELHDEDFRIESGNQPDGKPGVIIHCDKAGLSYGFDIGIEREAMLRMFRRSYERKHTRFLVYVQPGVMTVQTYD